jgi:DNA-binding transcriptional LysR family regulator
MLELRHLKYFAAVAREGNIGRAALSLNISQPPLTRQIQQLEEFIGAPLFIRSVKGVELTAAGEALYKDAQSILTLAGLAVERTRRAAKGQLGRLDIGIFGTGVFDVVPRVLRKFRNEFPDVEIALHTMTKDEQLEALRQRRIDIGFNRLIPKNPDIKSRVVMWERLMVGLHSSNPLATHEVISFSDLADQPLVLFPSRGHPNFSDFVAHKCREYGFIPQVVQEVGDAVTGVALVASGFGVCIIPQSATHFKASGMVYRPMKESPPTMLDVSCLYCQGDPSPILSEFLRVIEEFRAENGVEGDA